MSRLKKIVTKLLDIIELHVPAVLFSAVFIMYIIMIAYRYVLHKTVFELNELCQVLYVASALTAASYCGRTDSHVIFPLLYDRLSAKVQKIFRLISNVITTVLLVALWYPTLEEAIWMHRKRTEVLDIRFSWMYALWLLFMTLSIIYCVFNFIKDIKTPATKQGTMAGVEAQAEAEAESTVE